MKNLAKNKEIETHKSNWFNVHLSFSRKDRKKAAGNLEKFICCLQVRKLSYGKNFTV